VAVASRPWQVERLARDGAAGPQVWRVLRSARTPRAAARGTHFEVDKTRQVLFEVRRGRVARVIHVSTGATGNTPLGRWRIYLKTPGFNSLGMYCSMDFLRGFAIHGYASVPPYPASHGYVRVPLWFAPGLYARWAVGDRVLVHASAARVRRQLMELACTLHHALGLAPTVPGGSRVECTTRVSRRACSTSP
jgi:hypothetical protein